MSDNKINKDDLREILKAKVLITVFKNKDGEYEILHNGGSTLEELSALKEVFLYTINEEIEMIIRENEC